MSTWPDGSTTLRSVRSVLDNLYEGSINVREYASEATLKTDGTTAIQQALDDAKVVAGRGHMVVIPTLSTNAAVVASNLTMYGYTGLRGELMGATYLTRLPGSTGPFIREKTIAEGNAQGASGLWVRDLLVNMNNTSGTGIYLGYQVPDAQLNFNSAISHVSVRNSLDSYGFDVNQNSAACDYLWSSWNYLGSRFTGDASTYTRMFCDFSDQQNITIGGNMNNFFGMHTEGSVNDVEHVKFTGSFNTINNLTSGLGSRNLTKFVLQAAGASGNRVNDYCFYTSDGHTWTNGILDASWNIGTGTQPYGSWIDDVGIYPTMLYNGNKGTFRKFSSETVGADGLVIIPYVGAPGQLITPDMSDGVFQRINVTDTNTFTIKTPTNMVSGQRLTLDIANGAGGPTGAVSWDAIYRRGGAYVPPANNMRNTISFYCDSSARMTEIARTADMTI